MQENISTARILHYAVWLLLKLFYFIKLCIRAKKTKDWRENDWRCLPVSNLMLDDRDLRRSQLELLRQAVESDRRVRLRKSLTYNWS